MAKKKKKPRQKLKKHLDDLWRECVKLRASSKSELSDQEGVDCHHIARKPNDFLRYDLDNGICLTKWEHRYGIHGNHEEKYRDLIKKVRGEDIYEKLRMRRNYQCDLKEVELYLKQKLKELKDDLL